MRVAWTKDANRQKDQVAAYIRNEFGYKREKKFRQEVDSKIRLLMRSPNVGKLDPLFENRPLAYRSIIVNGLNKLVYRIDNDIIYIVGFWDTRTDDENQAAKVK